MNQALGRLSATSKKVVTFDWDSRLKKWLLPIEFQKMKKQKKTHWESSLRSARPMAWLFDESKFQRMDQSNSWKMEMFHQVCLIIHQRINYQPTNGPTNKRDATDLMWRYTVTGINITILMHIINIASQYIGRSSTKYNSADFKSERHTCGSHLRGWTKGCLCCCWWASAHNKFERHHSIGMYQ